MNNGSSTILPHKKKMSKQLKNIFFSGHMAKNLKNVNKENKTQKIKICQA